VVTHMEDEDGFLRNVEGRNTLRYINHVEEPNCEFDGIHLFARGRSVRMRSLLLIMGGAIYPPG